MAKQTAGTPTTALRRSLGGNAADLYDDVSARFPRFADGFVQRRASTADDAFRHLLRASLENTAAPGNWQESVWPDREVAIDAQDDDAVARARLILEDEAPGGWRELWLRKNSQDRAMIYGLYIAAGVIVVVVALYNVFN